MSSFVRMTEKNKNQRSVAPRPKMAPYAIAHNQEWAAALSVIMVITVAQSDMERSAPVIKRGT